MAAHEATALTGVFAPGSPPLPETLRTLAVTPRRAVTPGESIRVTFAFSNLGGAPATGVRVRFANPSGATYLEGSDTVDDSALGRETFVANAGAPLRDLDPNEQRSVSCSFRVDDRVEDGTELLFQAALVTDQTPVVASNAQRLVVRSAPVLQNAASAVAIMAPASPKPGDLLTIRASITNTGSSSAHDVRVFLPVPQHAQYVPRSARVAGRALPDSKEEPFDYGSDRAIAARLAPGQTVEAEYQAVIDSPLADGSRIKVRGAIASREVGEFTIESSEITISSPPSFATEETALTVFCDDVTAPGTRVPISVRAFNSGTGAAHNLSIAIDLPPGMAYTPGSAHLDGQPVADEHFAGGAFSLGTLAAGRSLEAGIGAVVVMQHSDELPITATVRWRAAPGGAGPAGERRFTRTLRVRVAPRFNRTRNFIEADRALVQAREDVTFHAHVFNDGTAAQHNVQLRVIPGAFLEDIRIAESADEPQTYREPFVLGIVQPHAERIFTIRARVSSPVADRARVTLGAVLEFANETFDLGVASLIVRSRPHVHREACSWFREQSEPLRPGQTHELTIRFTNDGADMLRDARLDVQLPPELALERAENARRDGSALLFGDVPAETTHEARVALRLVRPPRAEGTLRIEGRLSGFGVSAVQFDPLDLPTFAQPDFAQSAGLRANPQENIKAGERVTYEIVLRNEGDGPADELIVRAVPSNLAVYVPGSTQLNGVVMPDDLGTSQLWSGLGLALTDVNPGADVRVRWEMLVIAPIAAGTAIDARAVIEWDGGHSLALAAPPLRVLSSPSLEAGAARTPISLAQLSPPLAAPEPETIVPIDAGAAQLVPLEQPAAQAEAPPIQLAQPAAQPIDAPFAAIESYDEAILVRESAPILYADLPQEEIETTLRALEGDAGGLTRHLVAVGMLLPRDLAGVVPQDREPIANAVRAIRAPIDRFFVRMPVPGAPVSAKDLEDRQSRAALIDLLQRAEQTQPDALPERSVEIVRLSGAVDVRALQERIGDLEASPLGSALAWTLIVHLLGSVIEYDDASRAGAPAKSHVLGLYRTELIKVFGVLETLPISEFHRVLASSVNRTLDDALDSVLDVLRAAAYSLR